MSVESPLVSVIIPCYNGEEFVVEAVKSALAQTYANFEVIVVDDGSTDSSAELLKPFQGRIQYIHQSNQGLSAARNKGIAQCRGELIAFLDADDLWQPEKMERQVRRFIEDKKVGLVHTYVVEVDMSGKPLSRQKTPRIEFDGDCYHEFLWRNSGPPSAVMVSRECLQEVGAFDEKITRPSTQDYDLWLRISRRYRLSFINEPLVLYRVHPNNASKNALMMDEDELYVIRKALREDVSLRKTHSASKINHRISKLYFNISYGNWQRGRTGKAIANALISLRYSPGDAANWRLLARSFIPRAKAKSSHGVKGKEYQPFDAGDAASTRIETATPSGGN